MKIIYAPDCWKTNPIQSQSKPIQTQYKPNSLDAQMNISSILTKDYERNDAFAVPENKAKTNPKQTQSNPTCRGVASGETQSNPILSASGGFKRGTYAAAFDD